MGVGCEVSGWRARGQNVRRGWARALAPISRAHPPMLSLVDELEGGIPEEQRHFAAFAARVSSRPPPSAHAPALHTALSPTPRTRPPLAPPPPPPPAQVARAPSQCLRYCFQPGAAPLWPSPKGAPGEGDVPRCERCGAERRFEMQVMPQARSEGVVVGDGWAAGLRCQGVVSLDTSAPHLPPPPLPSPPPHTTPPHS